MSDHRHQADLAVARIKAGKRCKAGVHNHPIDAAQSPTITHIAIARSIAP
jgi:hypothetical protein